MPRKLGSTQEAMLRHLREHKYWHSGCGWYWDSYKGTEKIMQSLVRAGVARLDDVTIHGNKCYLPVKEAVNA